MHNFLNTETPTDALLAPVWEVFVKQYTVAGYLGKSLFSFF